MVADCGSLRLVLTGALGRIRTGDHRFRRPPDRRRGIAIQVWANGFR